MNAHRRHIFDCKIWSGAILRICLNRRRHRDVPDRWFPTDGDAESRLRRCSPMPCIPQMPMESAISAQGLLRASSSSKVNSTGAFSASTSGSFPHHGNATRQPQALIGANDPS